MLNRNRSFGKICTMCLALITSTMMSGCGNAIPDMTEEQEAMIITYSADVIARQSEHQLSRLVDINKEAKRRELIAERAAKVQAFIDSEKAAEEEEKAEAEEKLANTEVIGGENAVSSASIDQLASFLGLDGFAVSYEGYELTTSYPDADGEEWTPTIDASDGKQLLVVKLGLTNEQDTDAQVDLLSKGPIFHIDAQSGESGTAMTTMLLDDFAYASETLGPNETRTYVLVIQVDESVTDVQGLSLLAKVDGNSKTFSL